MTDDFNTYGDPEDDEDLVAVVDELELAGYREAPGTLPEPDDELSEADQRLADMRHAMAEQKRTDDEMGRRVRAVIDPVEAPWVPAPEGAYEEFASELGSVAFGELYGMLKDANAATEARYAARDAVVAPQEREPFDWGTASSAVVDAVGEAVQSGCVPDRIPAEFVNRAAFVAFLRSVGVEVAS